MTIDLILLKDQLEPMRIASQFLLVSINRRNYLALRLQDPLNDFFECLKVEHLKAQTCFLGSGLEINLVDAVSADQS